MSRVVVNSFSISLDGFGTGEGQTLEEPFGHAGHRLHEWYGQTSMREIFGMPPWDRGGVDDALVRSGWEGTVGAEIMGRSKFAPQQTGPWTDLEWRGWWGEEPPFHTPVFVLTHYPRESIEVGETTFHFIDANPANALALAKAAAGDKAVRIGGGPTTVREFLAAGLIDTMHLVTVPIVLGRGERLWDGLEGIEASYDIETVHSPTSRVTHQIWNRKAA